jgi:membrane protein DedA with SNARE-associated domain
MIKTLRAPSLRLLLTIVMIASALATLWFGFRTYRTFVLLRAAYDVGKPEVANLRAWMTLDYVATTFRAPLPQLKARLGLPPETPPDTALRAIADARGVARFDFVRDVQRALADVGAGDIAPKAANGTRSSSRWTDSVLSALLAYGYPMLAVTFLLGAIGLPLPIGLAAVLAGSLAAAGKIGLIAAATIVILASLAGDLAVYAIGRIANENFLARRGRWLGYSARGRERVESLFERWGGLTIVLTRTLVSHLSALVSLFAGISRYRLLAFLALTVIGRALWTSAYVGLGYSIGDDIEVASGFLGNLTGLLLSLAALSVTAAYRAGLVQGASPERPG